MFTLYAWIMENCNEPFTLFYGLCFRSYTYGEGDVPQQEFHPFPLPFHLLQLHLKSLICPRPNSRQPGGYAKPEPTKNWEQNRIIQKINHNIPSSKCKTKSYLKTKPTEIK